MADARDAASGAGAGAVPAAALERALRTAQSERRAPSVVAAVVHGRDIVWSGAVGDARPGEPATPDHAYRIGSITKTVTGAAILQLRDEGALDLDDRLEQHLDVPAHGGPTLRRLLSHLSGLQREPPGEIWQSLVDHEERALLDRLADACQVLPGGQRFHYSNLAFALLGQVVARHAGVPWEQAVRERLLEPLGLARTTFDATAPHADGFFVRPYEDVLDREAHVRLAATAPAAQLWSTVGDLCAWSAFLGDPDPAVLAPATMEEARVPAAVADDAWLRAFGLGVILYRRADRVYAGHGGAMPGFLAEVVYAPKERVGAAVVANTTAGFDAGGLALELADLAADALAAPVEWRPGEPAPAELRTVLGHWWSEGTEFTFRWRDGALEAQPVGAPRGKQVSRFRQEGSDRFRVESGRERGEVLLLERGEAVGGAPATVVRMLWATYAFTREPVIFGQEQPRG